MKELLHRLWGGISNAVYKRKTEKNRIIVGVICGDDFERTKYIVSAAMMQNDVRFSILVVGRKTDVESFEELFSMLNYPGENIENTDIWFDEKTQSNDSVFLRYIIKYGRENGYQKLVLLNSGIAFYDRTSLKRLADDAAYGLNIAGEVNVIRDDGIYMGTGKEDPSAPVGPMLINLEDVHMSEDVTGQYVVCQDVKGQVENGQTKRSGIKVVFFCREYHLWSSVQTLYESMQKNGRTNPVLVYVPGFHINADAEKVKRGIEDYKGHGYKIVLCDEYDIKEKKPDIAVFNLPYSNTREDCTVDYVSKYVRRCIYVPYGYYLNTTWDGLLRMRYKIAMIYLAWIVFWGDQSELDFAKRYAWNKGINFAAVGLPRMDLIRELSVNSYPEYADHIRTLAKGRKVILWNTHHSMNSDEVCWSSWGKMGNQILDFIQKGCEDIFVVWRPHPLFYGAIEKRMGKDEADLFWEKVKAVENIYIDEKETYLYGFSVADIMLSDASSMAKEFLYTGKPVVVTMSEEGIIENIHPYECLYLCNSMAEVAEILTNLVNGIDRKAAARTEYLDDVIKDEKVGDVMLRYILKKYDSETA